MHRSLFLTVLAGAALVAGCQKPVPAAQDGTDLWLAAGRPYEEILASVNRSVDAFVGKAPQFDDLTMLCIEYKGPAQES